MPIVRMPDGTQVRFPDDMPPEQIRDLIVSKFPDAAGSVDTRPRRDDLLSQGISGFHEGVGSLLSLPNSLEMGLRSIGPAVVNAFGGNAAYPESSWLPDVGESYMNLSNDLGAVSQPSDDMGGEIARRVGQEFGANAIPGAALVSRAVGPANAIRLALTETALAGGGGAGAAVANQVAPDSLMAELLGQSAGALTAGGALSAGRRAITPFPVSEERMAVARALNREGIDLTAGQVTGSQNLRYAESELGGPVAEAFTERQAGQFTKAALQRAGISADRATPDVMDDAFRRIGSEFDRLAENSLVPLDEQLGQDIGAAMRSYMDIVPESAQAPIVKNFLNDLADLARGHGTLPGPGTVQSPYLSGEAFKSYRSRLSRYLRSTSDPEVKLFLEDVTKALDDSVERYLAQSNPGDLDAWRMARRDYRNLLTLEKAATGAGELGAAGYITPARLRQAAVGNDRRGYVRGYNDFSELSHDANMAMTPLPNSGTAGRLSARNLFAVPSAIGGSLIGGATGDAMLGVAGGVAGAMVPGQVGRGLLSDVGRGYLSNQLLRPIDNSVYAPSAVARALAAAGAYDQ